MMNNANFSRDTGYDPLIEYLRSRHLREGKRGGRQFARRGSPFTDLRGDPRRTGTVMIAVRASVLNFAVAASGPSRVVVPKRRHSSFSSSCAAATGLECANPAPLAARDDLLHTEMGPPATV